MTIAKKAQEHTRKLCAKQENIFGMEAYDHHFVSVVRYAKQLAKKTNANKEIVEVSAWLHDVGSVLGDYKNHHITGAKYAGKFLEKNNYPKEKIEAVQHCIMAHRGSKQIPRKTIEAKCLADADAMAHFDQVGSLFSLAMKTHHMSVPEAEKFILAKLQRSYKKLTPRAKKIVAEKYRATKILLKR